MPDFENAFGVPAGHCLRPVRSAASRGQAGRGQVGAEARRWEHEEYDQDGRLAAVYESWVQEGGGGGGLAFVKYSPYGWVLGVRGRSARLPTPPARRLVAEAAAP